MFGLNLFLPPTQQSLLNQFKPPGLIMKIILSGRWYKVKIALKGTSESLQVCCAVGVVQLLSQLQLFETPWNARLPCPSWFAWVCSNSFHWVNDVIPPSHPLPPPSPALNLSQHQGLFQWVSSHQMTKVFELQLQHQSFQWIFRVDLFLDWQVWSPHCPRDCPESSVAPAVLLLLAISEWKT